MGSLLGADPRLRVGGDESTGRILTRARGGGVEPPPSPSGADQVTIQNLTIPGSDEKGFVSLADLRDEARRREPADFERRYPVPALHVVEVGEGDAGEKENSGVQLLTMLNKGVSALRYLDQVGFLVKRPGNPFPNFVSVGRAGNNDLVIGVETISKLHAYFTFENGSWKLTDYRSTNGTRLNGKTIEPAEPVTVKDGDRLLIGKEVTAVFLTPRALHEKARS